MWVQESYHLLQYGAMTNPPFWGKVVIKFSHLLLSLSSAINILIYSYKVSLTFSQNTHGFCSARVHVPIRALRRIG